MNFAKNKGMYIEELINNSAVYYLDKGICYLEKRFLPIIPLSIEGNIVRGKLIKKSSVDYCCLYQGYYIDMEVKQTDESYFEWSIIKKHQLGHLKRIKQLGGISLVMVYFFKEDVVYAFNIDEITEYISKGVKKLTCYDQRFKDNIIQIIFPGVIDFENLFKKYTKNGLARYSC